MQRRNWILREWLTNIDATAENTKICVLGGCSSAKSAVAMKKNEERFKIANDGDVSAASLKALRFGEIAGLSRAKRYMVATAVSELGTNICRYARDGEIIIRVIEEETKKGIEIVAKDIGPGIADIASAIQDDFSTSNSLGLGLPGVKRMMDTFKLETKEGEGAKVIVRKWV